MADKSSADKISIEQKTDIVENHLRQVTVAFSIVEPLHYALKMRAVQNRTTVKAVILNALKLAGFDVPTDDLVDRRAGRAGRPKGK